MFWFLVGNFRAYEFRHRFDKGGMKTALDVSEYGQGVLKMNAGGYQKILAGLGNRPHFLLAGHLLMLHTLAFGGWQLPAIRLLWLAALGLFLIWQPFVAGERKISAKQGAMLLATVLASTWLLGPWLLLCHR